MPDPQMFPPTEEEKIATLRKNLSGDVEKRKGKMDAAAASLADATDAYNESLGMLGVFDSLVKTRAEARSAETASVDPITGEVADAATSAIDSYGEDAKAARGGAVVLALYPGDDVPHVTQVGEYTRYSELVADYSAVAGLSDGFAFEDWCVRAEDELTSDGEGWRPLSDRISADDYGKRLIVAAYDQGSVTGSPVDPEELDPEIAAAFDGGETDNVVAFAHPVADAFEQAVEDAGLAEADETPAP